jgi:transcriptional regulator with XRE-family HTH domain
MAIDAAQIFHERLLVTRRRQELSQEDLASKAGMFKTDISKYERGISMPTLPRLARLAQALGACTDYLLGLSDNETCCHADHPSRQS